MANQMRTAPATEGNKFLVYKQDAGKEYELAKMLNLDRLMQIHGPKAQDYVDLTAIARREARMESRLAKTLSKMKSPFTDMVQGKGGVRDINKNWVQWRVYGEPDSRTLMHGDANDPSIDYLGVNRSTFKLWIESDLYTALDVIVPVMNKNMEMVIQSEYATPYNGGYLYDVVLKSDEPGAYFDRVYFQAGEYIMKMGSLQSWEEIGSFGSLQIGKSFSYLEYRVPLTTMGWTFQVEAEAHRQYGSIVVMRSEDGETPLLGSGGLTNFIETQARTQIDYEKELALIYGRFSQKLLDPKVKREITTSPGLNEWFDYGQNVPYSPHANGLDYFAEQFEALWEDRLETGAWDVELLTGKGGLRVFNDWVKEKFGETAATFTYDFVLNERKPFDNNWGRTGYAFVPPQFVEYVLPGYGRIRVGHWAALDDTRLNGVKYPGSNLPVSSFEFYALNSGFGDVNVKKLVRTDNSLTGYACGFWSPYGAVGMSNPYFKNIDPSIGDRYHYYHRESFGLLVEDPELLIRFRPMVSMV